VKPWWAYDVGRARRARQRVLRALRPARLRLPRQTRPVSDRWGLDRGTPVDRWYIERFLDQERASIRGRVLEVRDTRYTRAFGTDVEESDVIDIDSSNPNATIVGDLTQRTSIPAGTVDCFLVVQTLQFIFDVRAVVAEAHRVLAPGGVLLCTVPAVSRISMRYLDAEYWRFTTAGCRELLTGAFPDGGVEVRSYGNVLACAAFLYGLAVEELSEPELLEDDPFFPLVVTAKARKRRGSDALLPPRDDTA
jgi:SAM-dependent methyltransferase